MSPADAPLIAHIIFRLDVGGLENGLVNLINAMPASRYRHAIVCIDRSSEFSERIRRDDVPIIEIRKRPGQDPAALWRLYRAIRRLKPDILHTRNLAALDALLPARLAGVRHRIHGEHGWDAGDAQGTSRKYRVLRRFYSPLISRYVAVSEDLARYLTQRVGIDRRRIRVIMNGVNTERFRPVVGEPVDRGDLSPAIAGDTCLIGTVGRMDPVKDHVNLASAYIELMTKHVDCRHARLVIVGDGDLYQTVSDMLRDAGVADCCWLPGRRDDIPDIVRRLDVFVQSSIAEGISNTILEAMASGVAVVATDVGGNPDLVESSVTGTLVPPSDTSALVVALRNYVIDSSMRRAHGIAGRDRVVNSMSMDRMLERYLKLYDDVLS